jgi:hypothetical protein
MSPAVFRTLVCLALVAALLGRTASGSGTPGARLNPFEFLAPSIVVSSDDRARLDRDQVIAQSCRRGRHEPRICQAGQVVIVGCAPNSPPNRSSDTR